MDLEVEEWGLEEAEELVISGFLLPEAADQIGPASLRSGAFWKPKSSQTSRKEQPEVNFQVATVPFYSQSEASDPLLPFRTIASLYFP